MDYLLDFGYLGLFFGSFLAATILPMGSEIILSALLVKGLDPAALIAIATFGNVLGSLVNYALGFLGGEVAALKLLRMNREEFNKAKDRFNKYGLFTLAFAWVPIIGDPITVVAGVAKTKLSIFSSLVFIGKFARYIFVAYIVLYYSKL